ncbi:unnamed protein product [Spirodela intermedia]|uniref:Uncharacterized protein n=1 Tax=Spirodela intermedia TaxID=51605 RepID=A0A7I8JGH1_SPIIN|nr:unnamed protein product [Spirodela intermedia]CAA6669248.1 unnamed protein product [Spirodela intermedia]
MLIHCDNQAVIFIACNLTFHNHTKHIEINYHYIRDKVMSRLISNLHVTSFYQLTNVFTKSLVGISYDVMCTKLGIFDLYASA